MHLRIDFMKCIWFFADIWRQLDNQANQWSHLHLQPENWTALPEDHPHICVGRTETSGTGEFLVIYRQTEDQDKRNPTLTNSYRFFTNTEFFSVFYVLTLSFLSNFMSSHGLFSVAGQVEDSWGGGSFDSVPARGGAAQADHRHQEGHARPPGGPSAGLPQHCHQGQWTPATIPGLS